MNPSAKSLDNNSTNETAVRHKLPEMDLQTENQALRSQLEAERKARVNAEQQFTELKETFEKCKAYYAEERKHNLDAIECLQEHVEWVQSNNDAVLKKRIRVLEDTLANMNLQKLEPSASSVESSKHAKSDSPTVDAECKPVSSKKSESAATITLGLHMLLSGQRQMNLDGIMSLYTDFYSKEIVDDDDDAWKQFFVKVAACEMNGKMENISSVAKRLLNNKHTHLYQDPVEGVHVEKSKFDEGEIKCLELICDALCIDFTAN